MVREQFGQAHHDGVADGRAVLHLDGVDRSDERRAVDRGLLRHLGRACEGDQPHFDVPGHLAQERLGRLPGGHHAGGLDVRHAHAPGDVDREIEDFPQGSTTGAVGRARASSRDNARKISAGGTCRRHRRPAAARTTLTLESLSAGLPRRRSSHR